MKPLRPTRVYTYEELIKPAYTYAGYYDSRSTLLLIHSLFIEKHKDLWVDKKVKSPEIGQRVLAIQDLNHRTIQGKAGGKFVDDFYFNEFGFCANLTDDDAYGAITHWMRYEDVIQTPDKE